MTDAVELVKGLKKGSKVDLPPLIKADGAEPMQLMVESESSAGVKNCTLVLAGVKMINLAVKVDDKGELIWAPR